MNVAVCQLFQWSLHFLENVLKIRRIECQNCLIVQLVTWISTSNSSTEQCFNILVQVSYDTRLKSSHTTKENQTGINWSDKLVWYRKRAIGYTSYWHLHVTALWNSFIKRTIKETCKKKLRKNQKKVAALRLVKEVTNKKKSKNITGPTRGKQIDGKTNTGMFDKLGSDKLLICDKL